MPLYYFNIRNGDLLEDEDPDGLILPDLDAARAQAMRIARDFWEDWPHAEIGMVIDVLDEARRTVMTVPFSDAIEPRE